MRDEVDVIPRRGVGIGVEPAERQVRTGKERDGEGARRSSGKRAGAAGDRCRSEEHTSELQSLMRISYAVFCLKKKNEHDNRSKQHFLNTLNNAEIQTTYQLRQ